MGDYHRGLNPEVIVAAARRLGLANLSVAAVAQELSVSTAAIYRHIPSREALEIAVLNSYLEDFHVSGPVTSTRGFLLDFSQRLFTLGANHPGLAQGLYRHSPQCQEVQRIDHEAATLLHAAGLPYDIAGVVVSTVALVSLSLTHADQEVRAQAGQGADVAVDIGTGTPLPGAQRFALLMVPLIDGLLSYTTDVTDVRAFLARIEEGTSRG